MPAITATNLNIDTLSLLIKDLDTPLPFKMRSIFVPPETNLQSARFYVVKQIGTSEKHDLFSIYEIFWDSIRDADYEMTFTTHVVDGIAGLKNKETGRFFQILVEKRKPHINPTLTYFSRITYWRFYIVVLTQNGDTIWTKGTKHKSTAIYSAKKKLKFVS